MITEDKQRLLSEGSFARHETFCPRYGWLKKGVDGVEKDEGIFERPDAIELLCVGINTVRSIRFWCKWHQAGGPDTETNGIALCSLHHKLFDRGAFTLSDDMIIMVSDRATGTTGFKDWLMNFRGKNINYPQKTTYVPHQNYTTWHVREVFQGDFREF